MRKRTSAEVKACPHDGPMEEVTTMSQYGYRGDFAYKIMGCPQCGGVLKDLSFHVNYGKSVHKPAEREQHNTEEYDKVAAAVHAWREALPEPG